MNNTLKWALIIGGVGVSGVALYFLYNRVIKPKLQGGDYEGNNNYSENEVKSQVYNDTPRAVYEDTPFTNKAEGDKFRAWVNDTYPKYAKEIDLDRSGEYNNSYMKKAYTKYGADYTKAMGSKSISAKASGTMSKEFKSLLNSWNKPVYFSKEGVPYFILRFKREQGSWGGAGECRGAVYIFEHSTAYAKGQSQDARGVIGIYSSWGNKEQIARAYWSNYLTKIEGISGLLKGSNFDKIDKGLLGVIRKMKGYDKAIWC